ncbi:MAG: outer membrane beta-barrel protein [Gammaproteobacteria bacterium]|nr:outer membrane beta-barrel protein [Gammaproteobacteria bacterium]
MPGIYHKVSTNLRYLLPTLLLTFFSTSQAAAETSPWQGPYVGIYLGGAYGYNHASTDVGSVSSSSYFTTAADINAANSAGTFTHNPSTLIVGIDAGHDWVCKQMVYGFAVDFSTLPLNSSSTVTNTYSGSSDQYTVFTSMSTNWLFTFRGRVGYQTTFYDKPSLLYLTGGMAMTELKVNNNFSDNAALAGTGGKSTSENQIGWTGGAGIELLSFAHTSVNIEYLYVYIPSVKTNSSISNSAAGFGIPPGSLSNSFSTSGQFHTSLLKVGLNYRFDE